MIPYGSMVKADIAFVERVIQKLMTDNKCPVCGEKTWLRSKDQFGTIRVECREHGSFSLQEELV